MSASELEELKRQLEALRNPAPTPSPAPTELEILKKQLEELQRPAPPPFPAASANSELEEMKRQLEALRNPAPTPPAPTELELLKKQLEELQRPAPPPFPAASASSELEELKRQLESLRNPVATPRESELDRLRRELAEEKKRAEQFELEKLKKELEALKAAPPPYGSPSPSPLSRGDPYSSPSPSPFGAPSPSPSPFGATSPSFSASLGDPYTSPYGAPSPSRTPSLYGAPPSFSASLGDPYTSPYGGSLGNYGQPPSHPGGFPPQGASPGFPPFAYPNAFPGSPYLAYQGSSTSPGSTQVSSSAPASQASKMGNKSKEIEEQKRKLADMEAKKAQLQNAPTMSSATMTEGMMKKEAELRELERKLGATTSYSTLAAEKQRVEQEYARKMYGVDVCFLMDCTGSMASWITTAKDRIVELTQEIRKIKASRTPTLRVAFVGYRDIGDQERFIPIDFFDLNDQSAANNFRSRLGSVTASGGADGPEDIAGAMNYALTNLKWEASTRLVIHFADAPCHGSQYHSMGDDYPGGCPKGLVPEKLLETYAARGISYNFGEISQSCTRQMTDIFSQFMRSINKGDMFKVVPMSGGVSSFLPEVVKSITAVMSKSGLFGI